ncbi:MAG: methylmalonyl-CoA mutase family protein [Ignavibacteria bacterium]|nr:methylmalonyl-CoA mutase family protein [Ignavibacteria bacterium]
MTVPAYLESYPIDYDNNIGSPGKYPYTRGIHEQMYRSRLWTMRQYAGFGTAEESNQRYKYLLSKGTTGLSVAFDLPTQIGYDSDDPLAEGEVGKVGVAIDTLKDMEILFDGIRLNDVSTSMTINATAAILLCMYIAIAKKQEADLEKLSGTIQNDILKEYIARGTYIYPPEHSMRLITDIFEWCSENLPSWNTISISGYHIREAGSDAIQEVAFTIANAIAYIEAALSRGLELNKFAARLSFFFNGQINFFEEIAKFRAARRIYAKIMKERFGATDPRAMMMRFHCQTAGSSLTAQQIENNVVRTTIEAMAAVLGGCQSLHTNSKDEALALPTEDSARTALRTQQIIAYESGIADSVDPLCGSYYVEYLTDEIEKGVYDYLNKIDMMGGAVKCIELGYQADEIARNAYEIEREIESKSRIVVGVNSFTDEDETSDAELLKIDDSIRQKQIRRLEDVRKNRDNMKTSECLKELERAASIKNENLIPFILSCVENYATVGEISNTLRKVWGEYR